MYEISSDTYQLQLTKLHHFKLEYLNRLSGFLVVD